jgi:murein L,D-transpeptidase YafK
MDLLETEKDASGKEDTRLVATYNVWIGPGTDGGSAGFKHREGDRITPVGHYQVSRISPSAHFHIFLGIDYPNADDRARFAALKASGELPRGATIGGDIGIHGGSPAAWDTAEKGFDWTAGCISVRDKEIEEVARLVRVGTNVTIED